MATCSSKAEQGRYWTGMIPVGSMRALAHLGAAIRSVLAVVLAPRAASSSSGVLAQGPGDVRPRASALSAGGAGNRLGCWNLAKRKCGQRPHFWLRWPGRSSGSSETQFFLRI
jgi:hypothetical protein